jgi:enterochelin esterase family protein
MTSAPSRIGPVVREGVVTFTLADPEGRYGAVGLLQELRRPRDWTPFERVGHTWTLDFPRLRVDRMEYQLKGVLADGQSDEVFCDPANPLRAPGAFGEKSVVEMPGYEPPGWLGEEPIGGELLHVSLPSRTLRSDVTVRVWTSRGADPEATLPLLVVHDGSEFAELASLLRYLDRMTADSRLPAMRAALLDPPWPRDEHYSASAGYARALVSEIIPSLAWLAPSPRSAPTVAMGASLGALALLHAHRLRPHAFGALFLQSGSYFRQRYDRQEAGFPRFRRISRFVGEVLRTESFASPVPTVVTCGTVEENLANNRAVAAALTRQGYPVRLIVNRDAHNFVAWRDTFDPHLTDLLREVWHGL